MSGGDNGDRAILAVIQRKMQAQVRDIWRMYARWYTIPGTTSETWDEYADTFMEMFSRKSLQVLHGMTEFARERLAELN